MKGLLLKDFYLMREKRMLPLWFILALAICTNSFISPIMVFLTSALLPGVSLFFDKSDGWDRAMHFLPYSARTAVLSKYALGGFGMFAGSMIYGISQLVFQLIGQPPEASAVPAFLANLFLGVQLLSAEIPCQIKATIGMAEILGVVVELPFLLAAILLSIAVMRGWLALAVLNQLTCVLGIAAAVLCFLSIRFSIAAFQKQES